MNENEQLVELSQKLKIDLDDIWNLKIKQSNKEIYNLIDKKKSDKKFVINSDIDFKTPFSHQSVIIYFDLEDSSLDQDLETIQQYIDDFIKTVSLNFKNTSINKQVLVYYVTNHNAKRIQVENFYQLNSSSEETNWVKELSNSINKISLNSNKNKKIKADNINIVFKHVNFEKKNHKKLIDIESRIRRATTFPLEKENNTVGEVYTASLFDLAELLGIMGDDLFKENLRYKVETDTINVDNEIRNTLENSPEKFWYLNNGITLIVDKNLISLKHSKKLMVEIDDRVNISNNYQLSVINGAQTLNVAADFFYNHKVKVNPTKEDRKLKQENLNSIIKKAKDEARVILRIIQVETAKTDKIIPEHEWINKIAIALNSQKPIKKEDIVSTLYFTQAINIISQDFRDDSFVFKVVKRGGQPSVAGKSYLMTDLAKVLVTYLEKKPGKARSSNIGLITSTKDADTDRHTFRSTAFINQDILINDVNKSNDSEGNSFKFRVHEYKHTTFDLFYRPVNFLMTVDALIDKFREDIESFSIVNNSRDYSSLKELNDFNEDEVKIFKENVDGIVSYGKYHLMLCIFENQLISDGLFGSIYLNDYRKDLSSNFNIYNKSEDADLEDEIDMVTLRKWSRTEEDAKRIIDHKFLIGATIAFYRAWNMYKDKSMDNKSIETSKEFRNDKNSVKYKDIVMEFNEILIQLLK